MLRKSTRAAAAQLYRDKVQQLAYKPIQNNAKLHIHPNMEHKEEEKEKLRHDNEKKMQTSYKKKALKLFDFTMNLSNTEHNSTIGARKVQPKKWGLGAKKGGLEETAKSAALSAQEQEERDAAVRLAYRDLGADQQKREEQTIEQENLHTTSASLDSLGKLRLVDTDAIFDDFSYGSGFSNSGFDLEKDSFYSNTSSSKDSWVVVDDPPVERTPTRSSDVDNSDVAQKKFGSAKAI
ncbi:hypothetical protein RI129_008782 [Pyrocoelia pectoralis]|uniref:Uncharacterized protein n=1 Tax=Pyrocoelia pectoralis TaxID=417401 RepID=A0AAN7V646_9COLE